MTSPLDLIALNSLMTRLVADGTEFDGAAADQLIASLPINSRPRGWSLSLSSKSSSRPGASRLAGAGASGRAPAGEPARWQHLDTAGTWMHVGMYRLQHEVGLIDIRAAVPADALSGAGEALLIYDRQGRAARMEGSHEWQLTLFGARFSIVTYRLWKTRA